MSDTNGNIPIKSAVQLLQEINSGQLDPRLLDSASRQQCVEILKLEGYNQPQTAQLLKWSEKTIFRDIKVIDARNALTPNATFAKELVGDAYKKAMNHHSYLMRLARMKDTPTAEKIQAEFAAWKVLKEFIEMMQSLGHLPSRPQEIVGDLYHHIADDSEKSLDEIKKMVIEIEVVSKEAGEMPPEIEEELKRLKAKIDKAELTYQVTKLSQKQQESEQNKEEQNDK